MKKYLLLLFLFLSFNFSYGQWIPQYHEGMVQGFSNGKIFSLPYLNVISIDTNKWRYEMDYSSGLYKTAINKVTINNVPPNMFKAPLFFIANDNLGQTNANNTWTGINYFSKIVVDTLVANNIDSVHSTYWYSLSGDTIGYINAATEKVAFFKKMTIGDLHTNTTVAENFIRSNQVQTDTIYPHSPLILAGDTTIAKKIFADSIMATKFKAGNILINGVDNNINGINILYANIISANGSGYFGNIKIDGSTKTISGVDTIRISKQRRIYYASNGWLTFDNGIYTPYVFCNAIEGGSHGFNMNMNDSTLLLSGNGVSNNSIYNQSLLISGVNGVYSNMSNIRGIRIGWTYDSVAVLEPYNSGQWIKRPFRITADTLNLNNSKIYFGGGYLQLSAYTTIANKYIFNSDAFVSSNNTLDLGYPSATWRNLYLGTCLYSPTIKLTNTSEPSNPTAGMIYYNSSDNHFYGYNGTIWKQLDN